MDYKFFNAAPDLAGVPDEKQVGHWRAEIGWRQAFLQSSVPPAPKLARELAAEIRGREQAISRAVGQAGQAQPNTNSAR